MEGPPAVVKRKLTRAEQQSIKEDVELLRNKLRVAAHNIGGDSWARLFEKTKGDGSGALDVREFLVLVRKRLRLASVTLDDKDIGRIFGTLDTNGRGSIEREKLIAWVSGHE